MYAIGLLLTFVAGLFQQGPTPEQLARMRQEAEATSQRYEQQAVRLNEVAGHIKSEADARALVDSIAEMFAKELPPAWVTAEMRSRVAHMEYESATNVGSLIPEQRVVDVWNKYVHEIGASDEALVTVAEIHNMRDAIYASGEAMWKRGWNRSIWTMPNIYALGSDGKVAPGCRALETLRVLHDLDSIFGNLRSTRERIKRGVVVSDELKKREETEKRAADKGERRVVTSLAAGHVDDNPVRAAEYRYMKEHGEVAMDLLVFQLFNQLFPE